MEYASLRVANTHRQQEWDRNNVVNAPWRYNELAGEVGELCNVLKKLQRERAGIDGSRTTVEELQEEIADVVICCDLLLMHFDYFVEIVYRHDLPNPNAPEDFNEAGARLAVQLGRIGHWLNNTSIRNVAQHVLDMVAILDDIAFAYSIDLPKAVALKFNKTSDKVGLETHMVVPQ